MSRDGSDLTRREFAGILGASALGAMAGREILAEEAKADDFFFIVAADPQLFWGPAAAWEKAVGHINRLKPRFAVVCGDLINRNGDAAKVNLEADEKMAEAYLKIARTVSPDIPLYNLAGNHDVCNKPTPATLKWYEERFGKLWYSFTHAGCQFIVLESDLMKHPEGATGAADRQMTWLRETLGKATKEPLRLKVVFMHHPMCLKQADEKEAYFNLPTPIRQELLKLFHEHGVRAVFSGHYHRNALVKDGDLEMVTSASTGKALGKDPLGMRIVRVTSDRIEHAYYGYEQLPERVEM